MGLVSLEKKKDFLTIILFSNEASTSGGHFPSQGCKYRTHVRDGILAEQLDWRNVF